MLDLTQEQLKEIEGLGELQFTIEECCLILNLSGLTVKTFLTNPHILLAYERGRLQAIASVRKAILLQAKQGSTPAQKQTTDLICETEKKNTLLKKEKS